MVSLRINDEYLAEKDIQLKIIDDCMLSKGKQIVRGKEVSMNKMKRC